MHSIGLQLIHQAGLSHHAFLSPYTICSLLGQGPSVAMDHLREGAKYSSVFYGLILVDSHWICFRLFLGQWTLSGSWFDGLDAPHAVPRDLGRFVALCCEAWSACVDWAFGRHCWQLTPVDCGTVALLHV